MRPHGTDARYKYEIAHQIVPCRPCLAAHSAAAARQRDKGRCARGLGWPLVLP